MIKIIIMVIMKILVVVAVGITLCRPKRESIASDHDDDDATYTYDVLEGFITT